MTTKVLPRILLPIGGILIALSSASAQSKDPGPRPLRFNPNVPPIIAGASAADAALFNASIPVFLQDYSVNGTFVTPKGTTMTGVGLGPRFNHIGCSNCHRVPFAGGASFANNSEANLNNTAVTDYGLQAPNQALPSFLVANGSSLAARLKYKADGSRDGAVYPIWTISGRPDAPGCNIAQVDWAAQVAKNNVALRITTPTFGAGLIEAISDAAIMANKSANLEKKTPLGITGHENRNTTDGTISKFGWKAQIRTLNQFSGEAFRNEMGITNAQFMTENDPNPNCNFHPSIEDTPVATPNGPMLRTDIVSHLMRFSAPPVPQPQTASMANGQVLFNTTGCAGCHTPSLKTALNATPAVFANQTVPLYSDLLVHRMGAGLADDIIQGQAGPDEFRTAPLWGIGQRFYFLHDGRTNDLKVAIAAHASAATAQWPASEANGSVAKWNALTETQKQDLLNFLRGL
ncbi:MAG: di-heme oxidoredictase family protein [Bryobacteraceae bacterium]